VSGEESRPAAGPPEPAPNRDPFIGTTLDGRYRVIRKIGEGGMGAVYLAEHVMIEKQVAIKVLSGDLSWRSDLAQRFQQEAKAASKIGQENIIDITDFGQTPSGAAYFVMEYLRGRDLAHEVRGRGAMPASRIARILVQVCRALGAAHAKGIFHRDLKPDNIFLVEREGRADFVKVLDFGLAKISALDANNGNRLTRSGSVFGTAEYMSPEQARGEVADHRTDVYAMGCILYEMLTGDVPFRADTFMATLRKQIEDAPQPPSRRKPELKIPPALDAVTMKALKKDRAQRYQTMKELALAICAAAGEDAKALWGKEDFGDPLLGPVVDLQTTGKRPAIARTPKKLTAPMAGAIGAIVVAIAAVWWLARAKPEPPPPPPVVVAAPPAAAPRLPEPVRPPESTISIVSTPPGADVMQGPERLGRTPFANDYAPDTTPFDVTVGRKGFVTQKLHVVPDRDREYVVQLSPVPKPGARKRPPPRLAKPIGAPPKPPRKMPADLKALD
jgi:serine/threonine-protein kinase